MLTITKKPCCCKETARCSVFLPASNDSLIVIDIRCIKADVNVKLQISNNTMRRVIYPTPIPPEILGLSPWSRSAMF